MFTEEVTQGCSVKKMFLEISQNSQENTISFLTTIVYINCALFSFISSLYHQLQKFYLNTYDEGSPQKESKFKYINILDKKKRR